MAIHSKPKERHYYLVLIIWTILLIGIRLLFKDPTQNVSIILFIVYLIPLWVVIAHISRVDRLRFHQYLINHHHKRWMLISPLHDLFGFKRRRFFFSKEDWGDPAVREWKQYLLRFWRFGLVALLTFPAMYYLLILVKLR